MSPPENRETRTVPSATAPRRKAVLFCRECGHESGVDGDWTVTIDVDAGVRRLQCPECTTELAARPLSAVDTPESPSLSVPQFWAAVGTFWTDAARTWYRLLSGPTARSQYS